MGRDLGNVDGNIGEKDTLTGTADGSATDELPEAEGRGLYGGPKAKQRGAGKNHAQAPMPVGEMASQKCRRDARQHDHRDGDAQHRRRQMAHSVGELLHVRDAANTTRVIAVEEAANDSAMDAEMQFGMSFATTGIVHVDVEERGVLGQAGRTYYAIDPQLFSRLLTNEPSSLRKMSLYSPMVCHLRSTSRRLVVHSGIGRDRFCLNQSCTLDLL